jgi:hypothetical protein
MDQHRLVIGEQVVREDDSMVQGYRPEDQYKYRLFHQMTRITRDRGALAHDDRLDALAGAVAFWVEHMALDQVKAGEKAKEKDRKADLAWHFKNQVNAVAKPFQGNRSKKKDGAFQR